MNQIRRNSALAAAFIALFAFAGRAHGAGGWPSWAKPVSKVLFGLSFAAANFLLFGIWWLALLGGALTFFGLSTGHGRFFAMQGANIADPNPEWIEEYIASWAYRGDITKPAYSWFCMGIKGLMIGLAAAPYGLALAVLWPLAYYLSFKFWNDSAPAEWMSATCAGMVIVATWF